MKKIWFPNAIHLVMSDSRSCRELSKVKDTIYE
jgi:hypothetical protein